MNKRVIASRKRLLRVRGVQHAQAMADAVRARDEAAQIDHNRQRLAIVRAELFGEAAVTSGGSFASHRELADRLEQAGRQLDGAFYDANRRIDETDARRVAADRDREIAERLIEEARAAREAMIEARVAALPRYRRMQSKDLPS